MHGVKLNDNVCPHTAAQTQALLDYFNFFTTFLTALISLQLLHIYLPEEVVAIN
jgi:hypothetical protein